MARRSLRTGGFLVGLLLILGIGISCEEKGTLREPDGGDTDPETCVNGVDSTVDFSSAKDLAAGETATDYICPRIDADYYKITIPTGHRLVNIKLQHTATVTKVNLAYFLYDANEKLVAKSQAGEIDNAFDDIFCVDQPGTFYLVVQDSGDDAYDGKNPYSLTYTTEEDKDANEQNDTPETATKLSGSATGYIGCSGDLDYYSIDVGANQLVQVKLSSADTTIVDLKYSIYDAQKTIVASEHIPDGMKTDAKLDLIHHLPGAGSYLIAVEDNGGDEGDPRVAYSLAVSTKPENDPQDTANNTRNDSPTHATEVGTFGGGTLDKTFTGEIASKGDVDYFVVRGLDNLSENTPAVMEVTLDLSAGQVPLDPSFSYIFPHSGSPCAKDECCRVLADTECGLPVDCIRQTYSCITKGDVFCTDAECSPEPNPLCPQQRLCAGATVCVPGKNLCGAEWTFRAAKDKTAQHRVITSQLLIHPGPWYIRVSDNQDDEYEHGRKYTLRIRVQMDPDGPLDNELFPELCFLSENPEVKEELREYHVDQAEKTAKSIAWGQDVTGYINYEGDRDYYKLPNPCPNADCTLRFVFSTGPGCPTSGAPRRYCENPNDNQDSLGLEFQYTLNRSDGRQWSGFQADPGQSGSWGAQAQINKCLYSFANHGSDSYLMMIEDYNYNSWSWSCSYTVRLEKVADGCVSPCIVSSGNCDTP